MGESDKLPKLIRDPDMLTRGLVMTPASKSFENPTQMTVCVSAAFSCRIPVKNSMTRSS